MVTKKKGLIVVAAIIVIAGLIYASSRKMNTTSKGQHNLYHPIGGNFQQVANPTMQPDNDTASFSASSSCNCNKKRMI